MSPIIRRLLCCLLTPFAFSDVYFQSSIEDVDHQGAGERAGSIAMSVNDDDFIKAAADAPFYMRLTLDHGAKLCATLVDLTTNDPAVNQPIYLALTLSDDDPSAKLVAPPDAVSIVRWVKGEVAFWLRIKSGADWIQLTDQSIIQPDETHTVSWTVAISATQSFEQMAAVETNRKNLPFNARSAELTSAADAVDLAASSLICVDLSAGTLASAGIESLLRLDNMTFDSEAEVSRGVYSGEAGNPTGIDFGFQVNVARGKAREVLITGPYAGPEKVPSRPNGQSLTSRLDLILNATEGGSFLSTPLHRGSKLQLTLTNPALGFDENAVQWLHATGGDLTLHNPFEAAGRTLYQGATLTWLDQTRTMQDLALSAEITVQVLPDAPFGDLSIDWEIILASNAGAEGEGCLTGSGQEVNCPPTDLPQGTQTWIPFSLTKALQGRRILPHLTRTDSGFLTEITLINTGSEVGTLSLTPYDQDGNAGETWTHEMPVGDILQTNASTLFPETSVSHLVVDGDAHVTATLTYRTAEGIPTQVHDTNLQTTTWRMFPGASEDSWDGLALVNAGDLAAEITLTHLAGDGTVQGTTKLDELNPNAKSLVVVAKHFQMNRQDMLLIESTQPISLLALRGHISGDTLWQNPAIPSAR